MRNVENFRCINEAQVQVFACVGVESATTVSGGHSPRESRVAEGFHGVIYRGKTDRQAEFLGDDLMQFFDGEMGRTATQRFIERGPLRRTPQTTLRKQDAGRNVLVWVIHG